MTDISTYSPNDIESIVLKDAASASIYGTRAVIMAIQPKRNCRKAEVEFNTYYGTTSTTKAGCVDALNISSTWETCIAKCQLRNPIPLPTPDQSQ
jgi:hypothetical protein